MVAFLDQGTHQYSAEEQSQLSRDLSRDPKNSSEIQMPRQNSPCFEVLPPCFLLQFYVIHSVLPTESQIIKLLGLLKCVIFFPSSYHHN